MVQCLPCKPIVTASRYRRAGATVNFQSLQTWDASHVQLKPMFSSAELLFSWTFDQKYHAKPIEDWAQAIQWFHITFAFAPDQCIFYNRPYALTSRLHNNDAMLGVKTCRAARTCCAGMQSALALSLSVSARARASPAVWHAGVGPLAACLAMAHVAVPRLTPNTRGRPSVTSYAYGL